MSLLIPIIKYIKPYAYIYLCYYKNNYNNINSHNIKYYSNNNLPHYYNNYYNDNYNMKKKYINITENITENNNDDIKYILNIQKRYNYNYDICKISHNPKCINLCSLCAY